MGYKEESNIANLQNWRMLVVIFTWYANTAALIYFSKDNISTQDRVSR